MNRRQSKRLKWSQRKSTRAWQKPVTRYNGSFIRKTWRSNTRKLLQRMCKQRKTMETRESVLHIRTQPGVDGTNTRDQPNMKQVWRNTKCFHVLPSYLVFSAAVKDYSNVTYYPSINWVTIVTLASTGGLTHEAKFPRWSTTHNLLVSLMTANHWVPVYGLRQRLPFEVVLEATAFSLMSLRADEPLAATMVSTLFFFSAAELAWDWVSMAIAHSLRPHGDRMTVGEESDDESSWKRHNRSKFIRTRMNLWEMKWIFTPSYLFKCSLF